MFPSRHSPLLQAVFKREVPLDALYLAPDKVQDADMVKLELHLDEHVDEDQFSVDPRRDRTTSDEENNSFFIDYLQQHAMWCAGEKNEQAPGSTKQSEKLLLKGGGGRDGARGGGGRDGDNEDPPDHGDLAIVRIRLVDQLGAIETVKRSKPAPKTKWELGTSTMLGGAGAAGPMSVAGAGTAAASSSSKGPLLSTSGTGFFSLNKNGSSGDGGTQVDNWPWIKREDKNPYEDIEENLGGLFTSSKRSSGETDDRPVGGLGASIGRAGSVGAAGAPSGGGAASSSSGPASGLGTVFGLGAATSSAARGGSSGGVRNPFLQ